VIVVSRIGCSRDRAPSRTASASGMCSSNWFLFIRSINTIALFTTTPASATIPINAENEKSIPSIINPGNTPIRPSGSVNRMINVCLIELNCRINVIAISRMPISIACPSSLNDPVMLSRSPPYVIWTPFGNW